MFNIANIEGYLNIGLREYCVNFKLFNYNTQLLQFLVVAKFFLNICNAEDSH